MALNKPILDARTFEQLRSELIARIPVYAPEWTDHNASDPGITLLELYAFLAENLLFRFNQIPEATYIEFLRLLQVPQRAAEPAKSLLTFTTQEIDGVRVALNSLVKSGDIGFSTRNEVRVLPVSAFACGKFAEDFPAVGTEEEAFFQQALRSLPIETKASETAPYVTRLLWEQLPGSALDFTDTVDGVLWLPVLAAKADKVAATREALSKHKEAPLLLNIGVVPYLQLERDLDTQSAEYADRFVCPGAGVSGVGPAVQWQIWSALGSNLQPTYRALAVEGDTSEGLTREGVIRLRLPRDIDQIGVFAIDDEDVVGTGELPPPLDDELAARVVFWLRAFRPNGSRFGQLLYVGANCAQVEQSVVARGEFLGTGNAQPNQEFSLVNAQIISGSVVLEVEEADGWHSWQQVDGFFASSEMDRHYTLDSAGGRVRFGNGLQGLAPQIGQRIRVTGYRYGGGLAGNVAAKAIDKLVPNQSVKLFNPLPAQGGADAESVEAALDRIPGELRRRDRAVTEDDFRELACFTPGGGIIRAECLPRYHPQRPEVESAGVVSVVVFPQSDAQHPNAPMPDVNQLRRVCQYLDARRLVTTELYVLPPKYRKVAVAVGIKVKPGFGIDAVRHWVELVIRQFLAPLPPYGPTGSGWPLGRRVHAPEIEAAAHQVDGVEYVEGLTIAGWDDAGQLIRLVDGSVNRTTILLARNEVPELISITVESGPVTLDPAELAVLSPQTPTKPPVPIPVLREVC